MVWRVRHGILQVLLIHRPKWNDWSFPKGKVKTGESLVECAVREVTEEAGIVPFLVSPSAGNTTICLTDAIKKSDIGQPLSLHRNHRFVMSARVYG
ncbi:NUDIX domain-containing protein [Arcanobacterium canis]